MLTQNDICIVAVPSYGGRVPDIAVKRLQMIKGNGARAILIAVYGNRDYEDTLLELQNTLYNANLYSIAAVVAISEHSVMHQIAKNRPNTDDIKELTSFAKKIKENIEENTLAAPLNLIAHPFDLLENQNIYHHIAQILYLINLLLLPYRYLNYY